MLIGLTEFLPQNSLTLYDCLEFLIRIALSCVLGALIGFERTKRQKEAGIRTHCIIAVTSATFMILSKYAFLDILMPGIASADASRIASQVVAGISFLGAGVIFKQGNLSIKGLTTAAGMWGASAMGMAIGAGMYYVGIFETVALIIVQVVLHQFPVGNDAVTVQHVHIRMKDVPELHEAFTQMVAQHQGQITESSITRDGETIYLETVIRLVNQIQHDEAIRFIEEHGDVYQISV